jgi:glycosyltransferase involved in cell wall biosynthesis
LEKTPILVIIIPCYNEEATLPCTIKILSAKILQLITEQKISPKSSLLFVDDGSQDNTRHLIENHIKENPGLYRGLKLPKNMGHQNALLSGLVFAKDFCDITITIDADLQDDIEAIDKMLENYSGGCEIVCGVNICRKSDSFLKRTTASLFYFLVRLINRKIIYNHADFRLMGKNSIITLSDYLAEYKKTNLFLRGIVPHLGYKIGTVNYKRKKRTAGKTKYSLRKMLRLAYNGFTSCGIIYSIVHRRKNEV